MKLELELDDEDVRVLRGSLLAARSAELSELERRAGRHAYGKTTASGLESLSAEVDHHRRRLVLLDRLIDALSGRTDQRP